MSTRSGRSSRSAHSRRATQHSSGSHGSHASAHSHVTKASASGQHDVLFNVRRPKRTRRKTRLIGLKVHRKPRPYKLVGGVKRPFKIRYAGPPHHVRGRTVGAVYGSAQRVYSGAGRAVPFRGVRRKSRKVP